MCECMCEHMCECMCVGIHIRAYLQSFQGFLLRLHIACCKKSYDQRTAESHMNSTRVGHPTLLTT